MGEGEKEERERGGGRKEGERTTYYAVMPRQTLCEVDVVSFHF
jgi:hypothetical protein